MNPAACKLIAGAFASINNASAKPSRTGSKNWFHDPVRLGIAEALFIEANAPSINLQAAGFKRTLKLFGSHFRFY